MVAGLRWFIGCSGGLVVVRGWLGNGLGGISEVVQVQFSVASALLGGCPVVV
jgi:hypothetical protein